MNLTHCFYKCVLHHLLKVMSEILSVNILYDKTDNLLM